jgi:hypothetical protein
MWALFSDPGFLSAIAAGIGPLAFFAAPTEEIERLLLASEPEAIVVPHSAETLETPQIDGAAKAA